MGGNLARNWRKFKPAAPLESFCFHRLQVSFGTRILGSFNKTRLRRIMKTVFKFLVIPVLCHGLLCSQALAKKDKSEESDNNKSGRKEQSTGGKANATAPQSEKKAGAGKSTKPTEPRKNVNPQTQNPKKQASGPSKKAAPPRVPKPPTKPSSNKEIQPSKKDPAPAAAAKRKDEDQNVKRGTKDEPSGKTSKDVKPMDLPGKRPNADRDSVKNKDIETNKRDKTASAAQTDKSRKAMDLPGKRPKVAGVERNKEATRPNIAKRDAQGDAKAAAKQRRSEPKRQLVVRPGQNSKQVRRPDLERNASKNWWSNNSTRNDVRVKNVTHVNNNFSQNVNWSTRRNHWGYNPWWNRPVVRPWYGSSWNGGWSSNYYRSHYHYGYGGYRPPGYYHNDVAQAIGWGLVGWSLGAMIYDTGYRSYYNPYPARPVYVSGNSQVTYSEPITQVAVRSAPADDVAVEEINRRSESLIAESQSAFKQRNYLVALEFADKAIAESPGDGALHEYRALILFSLGKFGEAAGVLNPVLASGPGWDWSTMIALYDAQDTYTDQLQRLETYTEEKPDAADSHFLLGYHYMVCGHLELATPQFDLAYQIMPKDNVSRELAELTRSSAKTSDDAEAEPEVEEAPEAEPVPLEKLTGVWISRRDAESSITLTFKEDGKFTWSFVKDGKASDFSGEYSMNDDGLLVLDSEESQMVASVELPQETELKFVLAGGPPADPGLAFKRN
jgi:hypothetical protein